MIKSDRILQFLSALPLGCSLCLAADVSIGKFGTADYGDWKSSGDAFKKGPASGDLLKKLEIENSDGVPIASSEVDGDGPNVDITRIQNLETLHFIPHRRR